MNRTQDRETLTDIFLAAIDAVDGYRCMKKQLTWDGENLHLGDAIIDKRHFNRVWVFGAGKVVSHMAKACEDFFRTVPIISQPKGYLIGKKGYATELESLSYSEGDHPFPEENSLRSTQRLLQVFQKVNKNDLLLFLLSGGASSLFCAPLEGISLVDINKCNQLLLKSGADIHEINAIRKHISSIKGGKLLSRMKGARMHTFAISDVWQDLPTVMGSGPTVFDSSTLDDCQRIIKKYDLYGQLPQNILNYLKDEQNETPKQGDPLFKNSHFQVIASNRDALRAAQKKANDEAKSLGLEVMRENHFFSENIDQVEDKWHQIKEKYDALCAKPYVVIFGGEPTLQVKGNGKGGRNQELSLRLSRKFLGKFSFLSAGTDGQDGNTDAAGAFCDEETQTRAKQLNLDIEDHLNQNDSYSLLKSLDDLFISGPTKTNVMDIQILISYPKRRPL